MASQNVRLRDIVRMVLPPREAERSPAEARYRRIWQYTVLLTSVASIAPLVIMTGINYSQFRHSLETELSITLSETIATTQRAVEVFIDERVAALRFVANDKPTESLCDRSALRQTLRNLQVSFSGFLDLEVINADGSQCIYVGPFEREGSDYAAAPWLHRAIAQTQYVSEVVVTERQSPLFMIAVYREDVHGNAAILRAGIDAAQLSRLIRDEHRGQATDTFLVNREGVLQTASHNFGGPLSRLPYSMEELLREPGIDRGRARDGSLYLRGHVHITASPFILVATRQGVQKLSSWLSQRREWVGLLVASSLLVLLLIAGFATYFVARIRDADVIREKMLHNIEYTNKLASIGRLAAGVAHEINNPMAIINEKAGLLGDLIAAQERIDKRDKLLAQVRSIGQSVERVRTITHRLLGFARHVDVQIETINLPNLLREVIGFLVKDAGFRGIEIHLESEDDLPLIESDRGQLQQVFINILNNALDACEEHGRVDLHVSSGGRDKLRVTIHDSGRGIDPALLPHIFEPFFSTKGRSGTGLGLSITHGIVNKLGGTIAVDSRVGEGTTFTIELPLRGYPKPEESR